MQKEQETVVGPDHQNSASPDPLSINVKVLREQLNRLSVVKDIPIANLKSQDLDDFSAISNNISTLYGSDGYNLLFKEIQQKFPQDNAVKPGTVAGYLMGCFVPSSFKYGSSCSLACLTGAPNFYDSAEIMPCNRNVYVAPFEGDYNLTKLTSGTDEPDTALVYIQPPFQGFSTKEVEFLKSEGVNKVIFSYYDHKNQEYFTSESLPFSKINIRSGNQTTFGPKRAMYGNGIMNRSKLSHTILFVVLILIAIYALWTMRNN
jgi:hypothetical protein